MKLTEDFETMTGEIARRLEIRLEPLQELEGGRSGARTFLVSVTSLQPPLTPSHMILRLESARRGARTAEGNKVAEATLGSDFVRDHVVAPSLGPTTCGSMTATFYNLAGGSLMQWR